MCYLKNTIEASPHPHPEVSAYSVSDYKVWLFSFQFHWDVIDIQLFISLSCPT